MRQVPREGFVASGFEEFAYEDSPLPIAAGQTISQPYIVAVMTEAAELKSGDRVLEIGTGSGYAAAVLSRIAAEVYTVERHGALAETAKRRFARLGYRNIEVRHGDGTLGWPEAAPFDAIIVTAGGPEIPESLRRQLKIGGRLVIPIRSLTDEQRLVKVVRDGEHAFHEEDLGPVRFVPLIGEHGWSEQAPDETSGPIEVELRPPARPRPPTGLLREAAERLPDLDDPAFARLFDRFADARVVLLGEANHGTSEFYRARAAITRSLIERHGFTIVAVEADWPDAAAIDRYIRHKAPAADATPAFRRFPTWMWRNVEVHDFVDWLRAHNEGLEPTRRAGFYGLDIYNMRASLPQPSAITAPCITGRPSRGICATGTCSRHSSNSWHGAAKARRRSCGRTIRTSAMPRRRRWARCAARSISGSCAASGSRRPPCSSASAPTA